MNYAKARSIDAAKIPVIDIAGLAQEGPGRCRDIADAFLAAARTVGFFYVKNHGVPQPLIDAALAVSAEFFAHTPQEKAQVQVSARHRGFLSVGQAQMQGSATQDLKESFVWGREFAPDVLASLSDDPMIGRNRWPAFVPLMAPVLNEYFERCVALGRSLLQVFAVALDADPDYFSGCFERTITRGSTLYYPPQPAHLGEKQFGVAPHTDYGCLTLLYQDDTGGLQVLGSDREWIGATPIAGTYVVNVGDLLARWSNDRFRSTPHRVVNESGRARQSLAVFVDPDADTPIVPLVGAGETPKYRPTTCGAHILSRFDRSFAYRHDNTARRDGS